MPVVNRSVIDTINQVYRNIFDETEPEAVPTFIQRRNLYYEIGPDVRSKRVNIAWMRSYVRMRLWIGERNVSDREVKEFLMRNAKYEATVETLIEDIEDGVYALQGKSDVQEMRDAYEMRKAEEFMQLLDGAFTDTNTLDGVPLIDASHPIGQLEFDDTRPAGEKWKFNQSGTWSNYTDELLDENALWTAREKFMLLKDHKGQPTGRMPNILVVGPKLERTARQIITRDFKNDGGAAVDNESQNLFDLVVEPRITDQKWFLFDTNSRRKPFVFWNRVSPQMQMLNGQAQATGANGAAGSVSEYVFRNDAILHGVRTRMGFAYGVPELVYGSDATGS